MGAAPDQPAPHLALPGVPHLLLGDGLAVVIAGVQLVAVLHLRHAGLGAQAEEGTGYDQVVLHCFPIKLIMFLDFLSFIKTTQRKNN